MIEGGVVNASWKLVGLFSAAVRRVQSESSTGSIESHRVRLNLTIQVVKTTFDATGSSAPPDPSAASAAAAA